MNEQSILSRWKEYARVAGYESELRRLLCENDMCRIEATYTIKSLERRYGKEYYVKG